MPIQDNIIEPSTLPALPQPGPIEQWVFEQPMVPAAILVFVTITTLFTLRSTKHFKRIGIPMAVIFILTGAGIYILGSMTVTDRELLQLRSRELVQSVAEADSTTLRSMLDTNARLASRFASAEGADRIVSISMTRNPGIVRSAEVGKVNAGLYGPQVATTQIRVRTQGDMFPTLSWWRVDWNRPNEQTNAWVVTHIEPIWIQGFSNPGPSN